MATDYEEKYKEILEWVRKNKARLNGVPIEEVLPELAESEDERIRRWLCDYFSSIDKAWIHKDITCIDILRWLEKQKEQNLIMANSPQLKEQKQEKFPPYVTGFKGHPDPAGTSDLEEAAKEYASKTLCDPDDGPSTGLAKESFIAGAEWQEEQKPAKWSEEDENVYKTIMDDFNGITPMSKAYKLKAAKWLKSFRPQYHGDVTMTEAYKMGLEAGKASSWKPSEGHLSALLAVFNDPNNIGSQTCQLALTDLYEQLKKL